MIECSASHMHMPIKPSMSQQMVYPECSTRKQGVCEIRRGVCENEWTDVKKKWVRKPHVKKKLTELS